MRSVIFKVTIYLFPEASPKEIFEDNLGFSYRMLIHFWAKIELPS